MKQARQLQDDKQHNVLEPAIAAVKNMCEQLDVLTPRAIAIQWVRSTRNTACSTDRSFRNLTSNIDRLQRDIQTTRETTDKLRVLNPIGTEDDSSFTSMLTNAQV